MRCMKPSGIGGQAVIEGVMMKNKDQYAVAVRKPNNEIAVEKNTFVSAAEKCKIFKLPIFRGVLAFGESMIIGTRTLTFSASFFEEEEETKPSKIDNAFSKIFKDKAESIIMGITFIIAILLAVGIFIVLPAFAANLLGERIPSDALIAVVEGIIRIVIFVAYIMAISQMKDIKRMFMYHGAEHKTINCLEQGFELTVENVKWQSRQHKRCGTSFMFIVLFVSILFFIFIRVEQPWLRYIVRILLIPVIAGVSYEFIRFAGRNDSKVVNILSKPGMWLQGLTTREPDETMIEVAIESVEAVFDWREFLEPDKEKTNGSRSKNKQNGKKTAGGSRKKSGGRINYDKIKRAQSKTNMKSGTNNKNNKPGADRISGRTSEIDKVEKDAILEDSITEGSSKETVKKEMAAAKVPEDLKKVKSPTHPAYEEEDEILRALDRYVEEKEEEKSKE